MLTALLALLSVACAVVPILCFLAVLWWLDRYDREPVWLLLLAFGWGAAGAVSLALVGNAIALLPLTWMLGAAGAAQAGTVLVAPLVEEPTKALALPLLLRSRHFDNTTDGFVYGAAIGLGFGMTENFLYFVDAAFAGDPLAWLGTVVVRTFFSALMHATASGVVGACMGWAAFRGPLWRLGFGALGLALGMGIHALWNGLIVAEQVLGAGGAFFGANLLLFLIEFALAFAAFQACLLDERRTIARELAEEARAGSLPSPHVSILASWIGRQRAGWLPAGANRSAYVRAATALAFRRRRLARASGADREACEREIAALRRALSEALRPR